jgi:hypothetical protein
MYKQYISEGEEERTAAAALNCWLTGTVNNHCNKYLLLLLLQLYMLCYC